MTDQSSSPDRGSKGVAPLAQSRPYRGSKGVAPLAEPDQFLPESVRVADQLRDEIIDGVRPPGGKLVERDIAEQLGVSRIPVRDALRTLASEGLVTPRPRSWAVVREFTAADVADLTEVRSAFEALAFRLAAERATPAGLERVRTVLEVEWEAARAGDQIRARRAAADFHEGVIELAGNELMKELQRTLRSRMRWLLVQHDDLVDMAREHQGLYDAVAAGDVERVELLVAAHLRGSLGRAVERMPGDDGAPG